ncbi:spore germination protein KA [Paenibacillus phyllosphaerae]|uniref:Spore germination protein KA n=1 Tax=Paenibacillus phyllosphaerae TaxID=274593 RepID=A0A7W5AVL1_9BACL|nr:spore germination protein [Paenibacillus phyllosphaerae]MBB3109593.1 spore germination protein KA [Paenibacillus phyllosphaerae]
MIDIVLPRKKAANNKQNRRDEATKPHMQPYEGLPIDVSLQQALERIKGELGESADLIIRELAIGEANPIPAAVIYIQGLIDDLRMNDHILAPLQLAVLTPPSLHADQTVEELKKELIHVGNIENIAYWKEAYQSLLIGSVLLFVEGLGQVIAAGVIGGPKRDVTEPSTNLVIRGPREGFTESIRTNTSLIRRKIRSPKLWLEQLTLGEITQTPIGIMYIQGLADESIVQEVRTRLKAISIDGVLESGYIEELISDQKYTPFPTIHHNERPDVIAAGLLEGRVAILVDGTPFVLLVPAVLNVFFQAAEDYYQRYDIASFLRMLRFVSFLIALTLPSIYVAIIGYHQEMIPTPLLLKLAAQREGVPLPAFVEAFLMEVVFEVLREAVVRMPSAVGNTISIVGGLVIGQSVVEAGFVSPAVVIIVSLTAISSFVSPAYNLAIAARLLRFLLLIAAASLGFFGVALIVLFLILHLSSLKSFGIPYLKPFAPFFWQDLKDTFMRVPLWRMHERPQVLGHRNPVRESTDPDESQGRNKSR